MSWVTKLFQRLKIPPYIADLYAVLLQYMAVSFSILGL